MDAVFFLLFVCVALSASVAVLLLRLKKARGTAAPPLPPQPLTIGYVSGSPPDEGKERFFEDVAACDSYQRLKERLFALMETEKLYLKPDVRITEIALRLDTSETQLSRAIKQKTGKNFCQLIHYFRVREAMRLFSLNPDLSTGELREMVGFNSQTTFNTAFGRSTGYTPAEWCRDFLRKSGNEARKRAH